MMKSPGLLFTLLAFTRSVCAQTYAAVSGLPPESKEAGFSTIQVAGASGGVIAAVLAAGVLYHYRTKWHVDSRLPLDRPYPDCPEAICQTTEEVPFRERERISRMDTTFFV
eukprot:Blabericola_migrator_1__3387@NODE_1_length_33786_cov_123_788665_g0_i0_p33_GENE_NODE_1_length_33786_cov_123_788665_g0_i0NODE_1_length_33786_cov_123_788665_g0_i0_p33_ORF_typecomplete_len111_score4_63_NODE_1_length_33786_cov_123_788665_g0_i01453914871